MSRLIDANSFKNFIESLPKNPNGTSMVYDEASILRFIDTQPTAYDVEKVVAELDKSSFLMEPRTEGHYADNGVFLDEAIKIVRKGGVE